MTNSPNKTASALSQASRVESGKGTPKLSIPAPPKWCDWMSRLRSVFFEMSSRTRTASAVTSGPAERTRSKGQIGDIMEDWLLTDSVTGEDYDFETEKERTSTCCPSLSLSMLTSLKP